MKDDEICGDQKQKQKKNEISLSLLLKKFFSLKKISSDKNQLFFMLNKFFFVLLNILICEKKSSMVKWSSEVGLSSFD